MLVVFNHLIKMSRKLFSSYIHSHTACLDLTLKQYSHMYYFTETTPIFIDEIQIDWKVIFFLMQNKWFYNMLIISIMGPSSSFMWCLEKSKEVCDFLGKSVLNKERGNHVIVRPRKPRTWFSSRKCICLFVNMHVHKHVCLGMCMHIWVYADLCKCMQMVCPHSVRS